MGLVSIDIICTQLIKHGLSNETPCALIQQGTTNTQKEYISTLHEMPGPCKAKETKSTNDFFISVVAPRDNLKWYTTNVGD